MRTIERSSRFKRDYKRECRGRHAATLERDLALAITTLVSDGTLEPRHSDHPLGGDWSNYRDCHIKPDLVLIYAKPDESTLRLVRLGSHSELFG